MPLVTSQVTTPVLKINKSYGVKERSAIKKAVKKNPITCLQLLIRMPKTLSHLSRRTINSIVKDA